jgi:polysaccharide export outer membrane protein
MERTVLTYRLSIKVAIIGGVHSCVFALMLLLSACAPSSRAEHEAPEAVKAAQLPSNYENAIYTKRPEADSNSAALEDLWQTRMAQVSADVSHPEFVLGPGDVLRISIPQIPQLRNRLQKISEKNTITLPLLGEINVAGMTEGDLLHTLSQHAKKYVYRPQVEVFVQHTENRQVAVIGSVKNPGRYTLAAKSDTLMMMIGRAGGFGDAAGSRIILIPALGSPDTKLSIPGIISDRGTSKTSPLWHPQSNQVAENQSSFVIDGRSSSETVARSTPGETLVISTTRADDQRYLELPARPGDVIIVPAAGQVTVQGWVEKAGAFGITPGMTVLGSIAAAGGALFSNSATLVRQQRDGQQLNVSLDLAKLKSGEEQDIHVQSGDLVVVERTAAGAVPYGLYFIANKFGIGTYIPIP